MFCCQYFKPIVFAIFWLLLLSSFLVSGLPFLLQSALQLGPCCPSLASLFLVLRPPNAHTHTRPFQHTKHHPNLLLAKGSVCLGLLISVSLPKLLPPSFLHQSIASAFFLFSFVWSNSLTGSFFFSSNYCCRCRWLATAVISSCVLATPV